MTEEKKATFESLESLKTHIDDKASSINKEMEELRALISGAFGPYPKDTVALVKLIDKVIDLREQSKK